jgi:hypothetical protein
VLLRPICIGDAHFEMTNSEWGKTLAERLDFKNEKIPKTPPLSVIAAMKSARCHADSAIKPDALPVEITVACQFQSEARELLRLP